MAPKETPTAVTMNYTPIIGLEIHVALKTKSGMFCGCPADSFGKPPNTATCPVCLGLPGALPVPNKKAIEWTIILGLALGSKIADVSKFDRKHYFYPDLPKGYQISQYDQPLCRGGKIITSFGDVRIHRVHLEEDTGRLQHATVDGKNVTLVDFNRSGVPLVEIVTEPDIRSAEQAREFLKKLHQIVRYLGISDADMEKGTMRLEPNISLQKKGEKDLPSYKVEVKNINSFRFAVAAIDFELKRHVELLNRGETPVQETRGWNEGKGETVSQRSKEEAADYRYFPEPDIPPMRFEKTQIQELKSRIGELPDEKMKRFIDIYDLQEKDAVLLTETRELADYFEAVIRQLPKEISTKDAANWIINKKVDITNTSAESLLHTIIEAKTVVSISEEALETIVKTVLEQNKKAVADYKGGKEQSLMFLMGAVKRQLPKADVNQILGALKSALS